MLTYNEKTYSNEEILSKFNLAKEIERPLMLGIGIEIHPCGKVEIKNRGNLHTTTTVESLCTGVHNYNFGDGVIINNTDTQVVKGGIFNNATGSGTIISGNTSGNITIIKNNNMKEATHILGETIKYVHISKDYAITEGGNIYEIHWEYTEEKISELQREHGYGNVLDGEEEKIYLTLLGYFREVEDSDTGYIIECVYLEDFEFITFQEKDFGKAGIFKPFEDEDIYLVQVCLDGYAIYYRFFDRLDDAQKYLVDELVETNSAIDHGVS